MSRQKKQEKAGAPIGNTNAEKWSEKEARIIFDKALKMSVQEEYDFIGEVAKELDTTRDIFTYLSKKFPKLEPLHSQILRNLEANCFTHTKKGKIREATGIVNLKSNYKWTDRQEVEHSGEIKIDFTND